MQHLFIKDRNELVIIGNVYHTSKGEIGVLTQTQRPHKPSSTGRVYIKPINESTREYFPSVINAEWKEAPLFAYKPHTDNLGYEIVKLVNDEYVSLENPLFFLEHEDFKDMVDNIHKMI